MENELVALKVLIRSVETAVLWAYEKDEQKVAWKGMWRADKMGERRVDWMDERMVDAKAASKGDSMVSTD